MVAAASQHTKHVPIEKPSSWSQPVHAGSALRFTSRRGG
jgi:hypothetical protein